MGGEGGGGHTTSLFDKIVRQLLTREKAHCHATAKKLNNESNKIYS